MLESDYEFNCPHCGAALSIRLDGTGGKRQAFVHDCETCCRPIHITVTLEEGEVSDFRAEPSE